MEMKEISCKVENVMSESEEQSASMISISNVIEDIYNNVEVNLTNSETSSEISKKSNEEISAKIMQLKENIGGDGVVVNKVALLSIEHHIMIVLCSFERKGRGNFCIAVNYLLELRNFV